MGKNDNSIVIQFGAAVRKRRIIVDMTLEKLAEKANLSINTIAEIERGRTNPLLTTVGKIAEALKCSPKDLFP